MSTPTYTPLATVTLDAAQANVIFNNIPNIYRDLIITVSQGLASAQNVALRLNNDSTGSAYRFQLFTGNGSTGVAGSATQSFIQVTDGAFTANAQYQLQILDYSATNKNKTILGRSGSAAVGTTMLCGRWGSTAAVNQVTLTFFTVNATVGSTFSLYGIEA